MELAFLTLDVFTTTRYTGNPIAIILVPSSLSSQLTQSQKQRVAFEFNLSETLFLHESKPSSPDSWQIDIFTDTAELPFAGHPTIGAASYVLSLLDVGSSAGTIVTKAAPIAIARAPNGLVSARIPHNVHVHAHTLSAALGLSPHPLISEAERSAPIVSIVRGMTFLLVCLPSLQVLGEVERERGGEIDFYGMLDRGWEEGFVAVYYYVLLEREGRDVKIRTRMVEKTMEDPATGSAACALGGYLALTGVGLEHGGRVSHYQIVQGVEMGRKSVIEIEVAMKEYEKEIESISLSGSAIKVMEGKLWV